MLLCSFVASFVTDLKYFQVPFLLSGIPSTSWFDRTTLEKVSFVSIHSKGIYYKPLEYISMLVCSLTGYTVDFMLLS